MWGISERVCRDGVRAPAGPLCACVWGRGSLHDELPFAAANDACRTLCNSFVLQAPLFPRHEPRDFAALGRATPLSQRSQAERSPSPPDLPPPFVTVPTSISRERIEGIVASIGERLRLRVCASMHVAVCAAAAREAELDRREASIVAREAAAAARDAATVASAAAAAAEAAAATSSRSAALDAREAAVAAREAALVHAAAAAAAAAEESRRMLAVQSEQAAAATAAVARREAALVVVQARLDEAQRSLGGRETAVRGLHAAEARAGRWGAVCRSVLRAAHVVRMKEDRKVLLAVEFARSSRSRAAIAAERRRVDAELAAASARAAAAAQALQQQLAQRERWSRLRRGLIMALTRERMKVDRSLYSAALVAGARSEREQALAAARREADAVRAEAAGRVAAVAAREREAAARLREADTRIRQGASEADARAASAARDLRRQRIWWQLRKAVLLIGLRHQMKVGSAGVLLEYVLAC